MSSASFWKPWTGNGGISDGESNAQTERTYDSRKPAQELTITKWKALDRQSKFEFHKSGFDYL